MSGATLFRYAIIVTAGLFGLSLLVALVLLFLGVHSPVGQWIAQIGKYSYFALLVLAVGSGIAIKNSPLRSAKVWKWLLVCSFLPVAILLAAIVFVGIF